MRRLLDTPIDWFLLIIPITLTVVGIITIYTISYSGNSSNLATDQIIFAVLGLVIMLILMFSDYRFFGSIYFLVYLAGLLLLLPLLPLWAGKLSFVSKVFGAYRWINLGIFQLQPAEIFKLIAAIFGARYLSDQIGSLRAKKGLIFLLLALIPLAMIVSQPDLGTAAVVAVIFGSLLLAVRPPRLLILGLIVILTISLPLGWNLLKPYQRERVETFLNPESDPQGEGYNIRQSLIAVGSGGLTGRGFGQGSQTVLNFLPVAHTDFIFAGYAEATGLVGSLVLLILYLILLNRIVVVAREANDPFANLLALAIGAKFFFQTFVHMAMNLGLLPVTGIPLPFMSYGGTALVIDLASIGLLQNIYIRHKKFVFR